MPARRSVAAAVRTELNQLEPAVGSSALAASALTLAGLLDKLTVDQAREAATVARELRVSLAELRALALAAPTKDSTVDDLRTRREVRRATAG